MNQPASNNRVDEPDQVGRWVAEAGDPTALPRAEHVERLRALLLDRADSLQPRTRLVLFDEDQEEDKTDSAGHATTVQELPDEFMAESNQLDAAEKAQQLQAKQAAADAAKAAFKETSDAAGEILRRLLERRRSDKNS